MSSAFADGEPQLRRIASGRRRNSAGGLRDDARGAGVIETVERTPQI